MTASGDNAGVRHVPADAVQAITQQVRILTRENLEFNTFETKTSSSVKQISLNQTALNIRH